VGDGFAAEGGAWRNYPAALVKIGSRLFPFVAI